MFIVVSGCSIARSRDRSTAPRPFDRLCARSLARSMAQSLDRSITRALELDRASARSLDLDKSVARSIDRTIARSLNRSSLGHSFNLRGRLAIRQHSTDGFLSSNARERLSAHEHCCLFMANHPSIFGNPPVTP